MQIGIIGSTGNIGSCLVVEALQRQHRVTAIGRRPGERNDITWRIADIFDTSVLAQQLEGLDVLVSCYQPGNASTDIADTIGRSIADPTSYARAVRSLIDALNGTRPQLRLVVVGGAGRLEIRPGVRFLDDEDGLRRGLAAIGLPAEYAVAVKGGAAAFDVLRLSNRNWTYVSPPIDIGPGPRTGRFRVGGNQAIFDASGRSHISFSDLAVAILDEIEQPRFIERRFTAGY